MVSKASASSRNSSLRPSSWDSVRERSGRGHAGGVCDASQRGEHAAGENPSSHETEHQQERQNDGRGRSESAQEERAVPGY